MILFIQAFGVCVIPIWSFDFTFSFSSYLEVVLHFYLHTPFSSFHLFLLFDADQPLLQNRDAIFTIVVFPASCFISVGFHHGS